MTGEEAEALFLAGMPGPAAELGLGHGRRRRAAQGPRLAAARAAGSRVAPGRALPPRRRRMVPSEPAGPPPRRALRRCLERDADRDRLRPRRRTDAPRPRTAGPGAEGRHLVRRRRRRRPDPDLSRLAGGRGGADRGTLRAAGRFRPRPLLGRVLGGLRARCRRASRSTCASDPDRLGILRDAVGNVALDAAEYLSEPDPEGWLRLRVRLDWPDEAPLTLLRAGPWVEVLGPPEIRARVAAAARAIVGRYEGDPI